MIKRTFLMLIGLLSGAVVLAQPSNDSLNMSMVAHYPVTQWGPLGASPFNNDIWGYRDSANNKEYALVGNRKGVLVVDVTNPSLGLVNKLWVPGVLSVWRDIKTWGNFAYAVHDHPTGTTETNGLMIINLDSLTYKYVRLPVPLSSGGVDTLRRAHNLWIDEEGKLYAFGSNAGGGGAVIVDVASDPWNPVVIGNYSTYYLHDGFARNDTLYGAALWEDIQVIGVALPSQPVTFASFDSPDHFAHNCWLSDDGNTLYTTDEVANGYVAAYNVNDLSNVDELFRHKVQPGTGLIPHNAHVDGDHLVTSYYTFGCHVLDVEFPELPVLAAYYDTSPQYSGTGYNGAWGAYPYLPSGRVLVNDIETGLWVLEADYPSVSRAEIQLRIRYGGAGGVLAYDSAAAFNLGLAPYVYWAQSGDTLWVNATGKITIAQVGSIQDSLVWPSTSGNPTSVGKALVLGSGLFPKDSLVADYYWGSEELLGGWKLAQTDGEWRLTRSSGEKVQWVLRSIDGREVDRGTHELPELVLAYPRGAGLYLLETTDAQGRRRTQKLLRP
ncbi:MAG: choice-of-anchor B family protein [Schleiferiaceae bacterium]|nr:choice-of-anchor B family protein [Schleiferiaceae bacterium]